MTDSIALLTAQISFLDTELSLIHIPIEHYTFFLQPILRLLFGEDHDEDAAKISWTNRHEFLNVSITQVEVSIICTRHLAEKLILPVRRMLTEMCVRGSSTGPPDIEIVPESYTVIQVDGQGFDAGRRVLELTGPLAMAGISIFFITTYFSDYILVPSRTRRTVTTALEQRGFVFSQEVDAFVSQLSPSISRSHSRHESFSSAPDWLQTDSLTMSSTAPSTPPAQDVDELQSRTFKKLQAFNIRPMADRSLRLVSCAGSREPDRDMEVRLRNDLLQVLLSTSPNVPQSRQHDTKLSEEPHSMEDTAEVSHDLDFSAKFVSITITSNEPVSILLEERLLPRLGQALFGAKEADDVLIPIVFDLRPLGFETTGIVGGVAGRLSQSKHFASPNTKRLGYSNDHIEASPRSTPVDDYLGSSVVSEDDAIEISFLSTAKSGTVIIKASQLDRATRALEQGYVEN